MKKVKVSVPATVANVGSGFDTLGVAVELRNYLTIEESTSFEISEKGRKIEGKDVVEEIVRNYLAEKNYTASVRVIKENNIPAKKGLGSSAAAIVSALSAMMYFFNEFDLNVLFKRAVEVEGHPDNVAAAVFGGMRVSAFYDERIHSLSVPCPFEKLEILVPPCDTSTEKAREVLPKYVPLQDAVFNLQRLAMMIAGAFHGRFENAYVEDSLHQGKRLSLCEESEKLFFELKSNKKTVFICGSGPSIAVVDNVNVSDIPSGWEVLKLGIATNGVKMEDMEGSPC